jgi:hypothetical protein
MRNILSDKKVYDLLDRVDRDLAEKAQQEGCDHCQGGRLHRADYKREPRGGPAPEVTNDYNPIKRYSFCCNREGCRKRKTPPSVRFLGRKVYLGVVVVLVAAMMHGPNAQRIEKLHEALGIDVRTLQRWRQWWLEVFVRKPFWKAKRARFIPVLDETVMPYCLVEQFKALRRAGLIRLMEFLSPITTDSAKGGAAM